MKSKLHRNIHHTYMQVQYVCVSERERDIFSCICEGVRELHWHRMVNEEGSRNRGAMTPTSICLSLSLSPLLRQEVSLSLALFLALAAHLLLNILQPVAKSIKFS